MRRRVGAGVAAVLCVAVASLACVATAAVPSVAGPGAHARTAFAPAPPALDAATVTERYRAALLRLRRPPALAFEYTLEQLGLHDMEQTHRVYRSGPSERDEVLVVDGYRLKAPAVRIITGRAPHYDIATIAPRPDAYRLVPIATLRAAGGYRYRFRTAALGPRAFEVREIDLDGATFLPAVVRFAIAANGAHGTGELEYAAASGYWLIRSARVSAILRDGKRARETIVWGKYQFPVGLPADTFRAPRPSGTPLPGAVPLDDAEPAAPVEPPSEGNP